jgi:hypothetical protein
LPSSLEGLIPSIVTMEACPDQPMADEPKTVGGVFAASLPAALGAGMFAIGALLISMQVQFARVEATVQQMARAVEELKTDSKAELTQLDQRVRALEMRK